jgi:hypothetical protein
MKQGEKIRENRLRRMASRRGLTLRRSRRRDVRASDFGGYLLLDQRTSADAAGSPLDRPWLSLDEVETKLNEPDGGRA